MKGYEVSIENEAALMRIASYRIHQSLVQKPLSIKEYWPLPSDKNQRGRYKIIMNKEMCAEIKKDHKLK
jgi:hypothetical protein